MSHYLIERIEADPRIELLTHTEVRALDGDGHLDAGHARAHAERRAAHRAVRGPVLLHRRQPATAWLGGCTSLDRDGFVLTDRSLPDTDVGPDAFAGRDPLRSRRRLPGVFAVGDVRNGSLKRVAAAVGEGSSAVRSVHEYLALHP